MTYGWRRHRKHGCCEIPAIGAELKGSENSEFAHHLEVWTGVSYAARCQYVPLGQENGRRGLQATVLIIGWGVYQQTWLNDKTAFWFSTPEAWNIRGPGEIRRNMMYQRARGVWELLNSVHSVFFEGGSRLNGYERIRSAFEGTVPDTVPIMLHNFQIAAREAGFTQEEFRNDARCVAEAFIKLVETYRFDGIYVEIDTATLGSAVGCRVDLAPTSLRWPAGDAWRDWKGYSGNANL